MCNSKSPVKSNGKGTGTFCILPLTRYSGVSLANIIIEGWWLDKRQSAKSAPICRTCFLF